MIRDELTEVLNKISAIEGRTYTAEEADAWHEVLAGRSLADALAATITFYSKPFTHRAYPGDINALVEVIEMQRVEAVGDLVMNEEDWSAPDYAPGKALRALYQHVRKGRITREGYDAYRRSGLSLAAFIEQQEVPVGG
ncbi:hypothetical protein PTW37_06605 [Arthrobacter agilis]|uniref:hypothetical protein n=1 Tax=Arthrobacter agilis TaxID=37921 RepID=UPI002365D352|nr:hypothetical protein [Arthrobacter agilis]WDF34565.1 hypothetical protein PTW37_06605 [Arthrobacter agilis]